MQVRGDLGVWRPVPWPLWLFGAAQVLVAARLEIMVQGPVLVMLLYPALVLGWLYFLLRSVLWIWLVTVALFVLGFAFQLVSGSVDWWDGAIGLVEVMLLLLPVTRRYFTDDPTSLAT